MTVKKKALYGEQVKATRYCIDRCSAEQIAIVFHGSNFELLARPTFNSRNSCDTVQHSTAEYNNQITREKKTKCNKIEKQVLYITNEISIDYTSKKIATNPLDFQ